MDPEEVQMGPVFHKEPGLIQAATAALCVSVLSACLFSVGQTVPGGDTHRLAFRADSLPTASL